MYDNTLFLYMRGYDFVYTSDRLFYFAMHISHMSFILPLLPLYLPIAYNKSIKYKMALRLATNTLYRQTNKSLLTRGLATSALDRTKSTDDYNRVLQTFADIRACAVLRTPTSDACPKAMQASIDGGFKIGT